MKTALYRIFGDEDDSLLYIGISKHFGIRWTEHAAEQPWWPLTERMTVYWHGTRERARAAERAAIAAEHPRFNVRDTNPRQRRRSISPPPGGRAGPVPTRLTIAFAGAPLTIHAGDIEGYASPFQERSGAVIFEGFITGPGARGILYPGWTPGWQDWAREIQERGGVMTPEEVELWTHPRVS
jgi:hypothetical protein